MTYFIVSSHKAIERDIHLADLQCPSFDSRPYKQLCQGPGYLSTYWSLGTDSWERCRYKCKNEANNRGIKGCCEARSSGDCRFYGGGSVNYDGYDDAKAVLCTYVGKMKHSCQSSESIISIYSKKYTPVPLIYIGIIKLLDWMLVSEKRECPDAEINKGSLPSIESCAQECEGSASMFAFGTNDFGTERCDNSGCKCLCETVATNNGSCNEIVHNGFRLYRYYAKDHALGNAPRCKI